MGVEKDHGKAVWATDQYAVSDPDTRGLPLLSYGSALCGPACYADLYLRFFPITYNTLTGLKQWKASISLAAKTLGASVVYRPACHTAMECRPIFKRSAPGGRNGLGTVIAEKCLRSQQGLAPCDRIVESLIRVDVLWFACLYYRWCVCFERMFLWVENRVTGAGDIMPFYWLQNITTPTCWKMWIWYWRSWTHSCSRVYGAGKSTCSM